MQKGDVLNIKKRTERERERRSEGREEERREEKKREGKEGEKGNEREDEDGEVMCWIMAESSLTWHSSQHRT